MPLVSIQASVPGMSVKGRKRLRKQYTLDGNPCRMPLCLYSDTQPHSDLPGDRTIK